MTNERFLVTGALGCLGSWVVRNLVRDGTPVYAFDLAADPRRMALLMTEPELAGVHLIQGDITDLDALINAMRSYEITDVIHLAALQVPACKGNPPLGGRVNVVGTINVFEAARALGLERVVYASSVAVYGPSEVYETPLLTPNDPLYPHTLYGATKQANEAMARIYWWDHGLSSIGLRPYVIYGPGRDQGMTSAPTKAMLAAAAGQAYHISYGGRFGMQYADDVANLFIAAARVPFEGAEAYNIQGSIVHMREVVAAIETAVPEVEGKITFEPQPLPFPDGQEDEPLRELLGSLTYTSLDVGVAKSIATFRKALEDGRLSVRDIDG
jgi:nucleoside-diphosphate-sugar epimerase